MTPVDPLAIPICRLRFTLRLTSTVRLPAYHGHAIHGLLTRALGCKPFPRALGVWITERWSEPRLPPHLYRFGLVGIGESGCRLLATAEDAIAARGRANHAMGAGSLDGCFTVERVDRLTEPPVARVLAELREQRGDIAVRFRTPVHLRRPRHNIRGGRKFVNREDFPAEVFLRALARRAAEGGTDAKGSGALDWEAWMPAIPVGVSADPSRLINIDFRHSATEEAKGRTPNPIDGAQGLLRLRGLNDDWLPFLALGAVAQVGTSIGYGLGRFELSRGSWTSENWCPPGMTLKDMTFSEVRLSEAALQVRDNADVRHSGWMPDVELMDADVAGAVDAAVDPQYLPPPMYGTFIEKKTGGIRALAIPEPHIRVLQRATVNVLDPDLDELFEDCSYAYRKGRSVKRAASAIRRAERDGFAWVLDSDITSFFDNVDWEVLGDLLDGTLAGDPLCRLIMAWMEAPIKLAGQVYPRCRGLPQGSPLSPMLANLYLDALDEHLVGVGCRIVRYADDFVVLCRNEAEARAAKVQVEEELSALGLTLNEDKTHVLAPDEPFRFLGVQFGAGADDENVPDSHVSSRKRVKVPKGSWLESVPMKEVLRITDRMRVSARGAPPVVPAPAKPDEVRPADGVSELVWRGQKRPLFVVQRDAQILLSGEKLIVQREDGRRQALPLRGISHLTLLGQTRVTTSLALRCADLGVPVFFCKSNGQLRGMIAPPPEWNTLRRQLALADNATFRLTFARAVVSAKLHNAATLVTRFAFDDSARRAAELRSLRDASAQADTIDAALGYEGRGARCYFEAWTASVAPEWGFGGRKKHPAPDPINAMLSLAYTALYHHLGSALVAAGLDPRVGIMHRERGLHLALGSDLQEEFRHLGESVVWTMIQKRQIAPSDFLMSEGSSAHLGDDARRVLLRTVESRVFEEFTPPGGEKQSYREFFDVQARSIAQVFMEPERVYAPFRLRS